MDEKIWIDELPQIFNVLKGDMSLVGPRPPLPREVKQYSLADRRRLAALPGVTCIWQISGRSEINFIGQVNGILVTLNAGVSGGMLKSWPGQCPLCFREKELVKMKTCLICPSERPSVAALAQASPLSNFPILGKNLLEYWLEHLAGLGAKQVSVLTADRPDLVRQLTGNGARWGLNVKVVAEAWELSPTAASEKYSVNKTDWLAEPHDIILMNHFPGQSQYPLFGSYDGWFSAVMAWLPQAAILNRIGVREVQPGVWVGMRSRMADTARLQAPCWIGEGVGIGRRSIIGPNAILENHVLVESDCEISNAMVGPETIVGKFSGLKDSLAWGGTMVDWKNGSLARVPDPFLMCALDIPLLPRRATDRLRQLAAVIAGYNEEFHLLWKRRRIKLP